MMPGIAQHARDYEYCTFCPKLCRFACPVAASEAREAVTPWAKMANAGMLAKGVLQPSDRPVETVYHCLECLLCGKFCDHHTDVPRALGAARRAAHEAKAEPRRAAAALQTFVSGKGLDGEPISARLRTAVPERFIAAGAKAVYFAGCAGGSFFPQDVRQALETFEKLGVDWIALWEGEPFCCGMPLYNAGFMEEFERHAGRLANVLSGFRTVVSGCPACVYALRVLYGEMGFHVRAAVLHLAEFLLPFAKRAPELPPAGTKTAYHDPCHLSRHLAVQSEPREIIRIFTGEKPVELRWSRDESWCCGGGGGVPLILPEVASAVSRARAAHVKESGCRTVVTACPSCKRMLSKAADGFEVKDLASVAFEALERKG